MKSALFLFLTATSAFAQRVTPIQPTVEELASALGVRPFCWDVSSAEPRFARLIVTVGNKQQLISLPHATTSFRIRVFLFADPASGQFQRLTYSLEGSGGEREQRSEVSMAGSAIISLTTAIEPSVSFSITCQSIFRKDASLSITMETSQEPFPIKPQ